MRPCSNAAPILRERQRRMESCASSKRRKEPKPNDLEHTLSLARCNQKPVFLFPLIPSNTGPTPPLSLSVSSCLVEFSSFFSHFIFFPLVRVQCVCASVCVCVRVVLFFDHKQRRTKTRCEIFPSARSHSSSFFLSHFLPSIVKVLPPEKP